MLLEDNLELLPLSSHKEFANSTLMRAFPDLEFKNKGPSKSYERQRQDPKI